MMMITVDNTKITVDNWVITVDKMMFFRALLLLFLLNIMHSNDNRWYGK